MRPAPRRAGISFLRGSGGDRSYLQERRRLFRLRKGSFASWSLPWPKESGSSSTCTRVCMYVRKGHNSCDINGISIAIWLRSYTCVQPSLQYSRLKLGRTMTHPIRTRVTEIAFVSSPNYIGSRSTNRSRNMAVPLYQTLVHAVTHA